jgi:hypothetical protein
MYSKGVKKMSERKETRNIMQPLWDAFMKEIIDTSYDDYEERIAQQEKEDWENREAYGIYW